MFPAFLFCELLFFFYIRSTPGHKVENLKEYTIKQSNFAVISLAFLLSAGSLVLQGSAPPSTLPACFRGFPASWFQLIAD